jgi:hypothetical protein
LRLPEYEILKRLLELVDTCEEGLIHINKQLSEGKFEQSLEMVVNVFYSIVQVEKFIRKIQKSIPENLIGKEFKQVCMAMDNFTYAYELNKREDKFSILETELFPAFKVWKDTLNQTLGKYVIQ